MMKNSIFAKRIIVWYQNHHRPLPWRETRDPYKIWLSEIILQQTRVSQGLPYYLRFVREFPNIQVLAAAPEQEVLRAWQGLGYYSRALNLHRCAKWIVEQRNGVFPSHFKDLQLLPGVGPYTAAAIASFAFGEQVAVLDGNVFRVLSRVFGIELDIQSAKGKSHFSQLANQLIPADEPALFNQAIMEFGATQCTPHNPACEYCTFEKACVARTESTQASLPVKTKKVKIRKRNFFYFVLKYKGRWYLRKREGKDIWHGLYEFLLIEASTQRIAEKELLCEAWAKSARVKSGISKKPIIFRHVLTHQRLQASFVLVDIPQSAAADRVFKSLQMRFYSEREIENLPKPALVSKYIREYPFS